MSEDDKSVVAYISGYVFGSLYRKIKFSKKSSDDYYQQYMSILFAAKCDETCQVLPEHKLIDTRNRSGLWEMKVEVVSIFITAEVTFKSIIKTTPGKVDSKNIISTLLDNILVIDNFSTIKHQSEITVKNEIAFNVLEDVLKLYIHVRAFSHVKNQLEFHKIKSNQVKNTSLHKSLKRSSDQK